MNIVRDGVILIVYTFSVILAYIFTSSPFAHMISAISAASDAHMMPIVYNEVIAVFSICIGIAVLIPIVIFIWLAFTTNNEEVYY